MTGPARLIVAALLVAGCAAQHHQSTSCRQSVVILYENDVHCHVDGYARVSAMKKAEAEAGNGVLLLSSGDFVSGGPLGAISKGGYIASIMNACGYDAVAPGNHEFDFGAGRMEELASMLKAEVLCCNFENLQGDSLVFSPYRIFERGCRRIAVIGVATPSSFVTSTPAAFQDRDGNFIYSLHSDDICRIVQSYVDEVRDKGAEKVLLLSHLGDESSTGAITSPELIAGTSGIDAVLDGHAHNLIPARWLENKDGVSTLLTSTGSYFENIGKLTIFPDGSMKTEMVSTSSCTAADPEAAAVSEAVQSEYERISCRYIGENKAYLAAGNEDGPNLARREETGLGDFCADAMRAVAGSDIAICGGGSIRSGLAEGGITFNDIFRVFPFMNNVAVAEVSGQTVLDALEYAVSLCPADFGGFLQVSGLGFTVDLQTVSPAAVDGNRLFTGFSGPQRRIRDVMVETDGSFLPIDPSATYTVAGSTYILRDRGDGFTMFGSRVTDLGILDVDVLETFIKNHLGGVIPDSYARAQQRIRIIR